MSSQLDDAPIARTLFLSPSKPAAGAGMVTPPAAARDLRAQDHIVCSARAAHQTRLTARFQMLCAACKGSSESKHRRSWRAEHAQRREAGNIRVQVVSGQLTGLNRADAAECMTIEAGPLSTLAAD